MSWTAIRFTLVEPRRRVRDLVLGLLSDLPRQNCWSIAEWAWQASPDGMQHLLGRAKWDADRVRDDVREYVLEHLHDDDAVLAAVHMRRSAASCASRARGRATRTAAGRRDSARTPSSRPSRSRPPASSAGSLKPGTAWAGSREPRSTAATPSCDPRRESPRAASAGATPRAARVRLIGGSRSGCGVSPSRCHHGCGSIAGCPE
ncbi:transposase [Streptomyces sp. NPDC085524]|uniref:transposase n=1 Tax=Streptomyces sp. NPDC085524 TaxID=3365728 RepID=UPI0037D05442